MSHENGNGKHGTTLADRLPPQNLEAERGVLGSIMLDKRVADDVLMILRGADFYRAPHRTIFDVIADLIADGKAPDAITLADELVRREQFDKVGGDEMLTEIVESVRHAANARYYAGIVREKAIVRNLIDAVTDILRACYSQQHTAPELISMAEQSIFSIAERDAGSNVVDMKTIIEEAMEVIQRRQQGEIDGIDTGFDDLDDILAGLRPGQLAILAARPSIGKTALGIAIAANIGTMTGKPVLFSSLEMARSEIAERFLSAHAEINAYTLKGRRANEKLTDAGWNRLAQAAGRLTRLPFWIDDTPGRTVSQIAATARRVARSSGLAMVMIDYLGLIDAQQGNHDSRQEAVAKISRGLKRMARELGVPVLALQQLNRKPEERDDRRPRTSDLRDSGALEQDADIVMLLHRPEHYDPTQKPGVAEVIIGKNRNGATGAIELAFRKEWTRFDSVSYAEEAPPAALCDDTSF